MRVWIERLLIPLLLFGTLSPAQPPDEASGPATKLPPEAERCLAAFRAGDSAALGEIVTKNSMGLFNLTAALLRAHAEGVLRDPPSSGDFLDAARAVVASPGLRPAEIGVKGMVEAWARFGPDDFERELRLVVSLSRLAAASDERRWEDVVTFYAEAGRDLRDAHYSPPATDLAFRSGDAFMRLRRFAEAAEAFLTSAAAARELEWAAIEGQALHRAGQARREEGRSEEALEILDRAHRLLDVAGDEPRALRALIERGVILREKEGTAAARGVFDSVGGRVAGWPRGPGDTEHLRTVLALATVYAEINETEESIPLFERALEMARAQDNRGLTGLCLVELGHMAANLSRPDRALELFEQAFGIEGFEPPPPVWAMIGSLHRSLGHPDLARHWYERLIGTYGGRDQDLVVAKTHHELGLLDMTEGRLEAALEHFAIARRIKLALGKRRDAALELLTTASVRIAQNRIEDARTALDGAQREFTSVGTSTDNAALLVTSGLLQDRSGDHAAALATFDEALAAWERIGATAHVGTTLSSRALQLGRLGRYEEAKAALERAFSITTELGQELGEAHALGTREAGHEAASCGLVVAALRMQSAPEDAETVLSDAFTFAEQGRGILMARELINRQALLAEALTPELRNAHEKASARLKQSQQALIRLADEISGDPAAIAAARLDLDNAERDCASMRSRIQREACRAAAIVFPEPVSLAAFRRLLPDRTAFIHLHRAQESTLALVVTRQDVSLTPVAEGVDLDSRCHAWLDLVAAGAGGEADLARQLYDDLLRPIERHLADQERLLISPDGVLSFLSFEALLRKAEGKGERVTERWETVCLPSATVYATLLEEHGRERRGRGLIALADPAGTGATVAASKVMPKVHRSDIDGLGPLPGSQAEVESIASLFPEEDRCVLLRRQASLASFEKSLAAIPDRRFSVHFACHGVVNARSPSLSGLILAQREVLGLDDLCRLKIPADLAVLSACSSNRGRLASGEGVFGLARGFFYAGCPRVVVSNWKVSDTSTCRLMSSFYRAMLSDRLPPAAALRRARLELLRSGGGSAHPRHWAAFVLWGLPE